VARAKAYIETSVIGYLTARPSRDLIVAACQRATQEWWARHARRFDLYASILVIREAAKGTRSEARKRLAILEPIPLLDLNEAAFKLAERFIHEGGRRRSAYRPGHRARHGLSVNMELQAHCQPRSPEEDRGVEQGTRT